MFPSPSTIALIWRQQQPPPRAAPPAPLQLVIPRMAQASGIISIPGLSTTLTCTELPLQSQGPTVWPCLLSIPHGPCSVYLLCCSPHPLPAPQVHSAPSQINTAALPILFPPPGAPFPAPPTESVPTCHSPLQGLFPEKVSLTSGQGQSPLQCVHCTY